MQKIRIDFDNPGLPQHISAVENDSQSRFFQAMLYENGKAYTAPAGASYSIMYHGFGPQNQGWYDTINDGAGKRTACTASGNVVTCEIARQALQVPGHVSIVLCVTTGKGYMLKSWPIECDCKNDRYDSTVEIQSFFYVTQISNESWTQAIQAVEELKNIVDPTLSLSGKAADAAKVGEAVNAESERAKGVESRIKESATAINNAIGQPVEFTLDGYLTGLGSIGNQNDNSKITDLISVERGDKVAIIHLYANAGETTVTGDKVGIVCFYDENKSFVESFTGEKTGFVTTSIDVPAFAAYVRLCRWHDSSGDGDSTGEAWIVHGEKDTQEEVEVIKECIGQPVEFTLDGYLNGSGQYNTGSAYGKVTDYIALGSYSKVAFYRLYGNHKDDTSVNESVGIVCFYGDESEETFISSAYNYYGVESDVVDVPAEAKYVRLCKWNKSAGDGNAFLCGETQKCTSEDEQKIADIATRNAIAKLESINKPFLFSGKTINAFGDSITAGVTSPGLKQGTPYIKYFAEHVGAKLNNWAVSGSTLSVLESWSPGSICKKVMDVLPKDMGDYIFIAGGTNDFNQNREIGSLDSKDDATVCGAVNNMCEYIKLNLSDRTVIFITPIPYTQAYYSRNPAVNKLGNTLEDYIKAIYQVATLHGYNVVNGYALGMPTGAGVWDNAMCDNSDGCHPAELGHKLYARSLAGKLL